MYVAGAIRDGPWEDINMGLDIKCSGSVSHVTKLILKKSES